MVDMDRRSFLLSSSLTVITGGMLVGWNGTLAHAAQPITWKGWSGATPPDAQGGQWGVPELWWYQKAQVFSHNADINYRADDATSFWVEGKKTAGDGASALFGVVLEWGTPLLGNHAYRFTMRMPEADHLPDLITVNDHVAWRREDGYAPGSDVEVQFQYVPATDGEIAKIYLIRSAVHDGWRAIHPPHQGEWVANNLNSRQSAEPVDRPIYDMFELPVDAEFVGIDPRIGCRYLLNEFDVPVDYNPPQLQPLPYPPADTKFIERGFGADRLVQLENFLPFAQPTSLTYQPGSGKPVWYRTFQNWAQLAADHGVKEIVLTPLIQERKFFDPDAPPERYQYLHLNTFMNRPPTPAEKERVLADIATDMATLIRQWLELVPTGHAYVFHVEMNSAHGNYKGGIRDAPMALIPGFEAIRDGGVRAWQLSFDLFNNFRNDITSQLGRHTRNVEFMANFDRAAFQAAYAFHGGIDIVLHKNIHRQSINVVVANSRGAAAAYNKKYGYDFDAWDRNYQFSYHKAGIDHALKVYFHSGAQYLMDEIRMMHWAEESSTKVSAGAETWAKFQRYVKTHPRLGRQQVRIGLMRGLGDEWNRLAGPSASWEAVSWMPTAEIDAALAQDVVPDLWAKAKNVVDSGGTPDWQDIYFSDYNLLNLVFADFGNPRRTAPDRLATGTPYGPVDFVPWDTDPDKLQRYGVIAYLGRGAETDRRTVNNLKRYVETGGTLVIAAGQLRAEDGSFAAEQFLGVDLGGRRVFDGLPYTQLEPHGSDVDVMKRLPNGDPAVVKASKGLGTVYLLSGEWLTDRGDDLAASVLKPLLEQAKWLDISPASDWIEYLVQKKGRTWIFPLFNHGRGYYPSNNGIDHGPWTGTITIDLHRIKLDGRKGIDVYRAVPRPEAGESTLLEPVDFSVHGRQLELALTVDELEEVVIGPHGSAADDFYQ